MKLKLSYSTMAMWTRGEISETVQALHGMWKPPTEAMDYGIERHKFWQAYVDVYKMLPAEFQGSSGTNRRLKGVRTEAYKIIKINDWLWLSGIADLIEIDPLYGKVISDYKTGKTRAGAYLKSIQVDSYALLFPDANLFKFYGYNQHEPDTSKRVTMAMRYLTPQLREEALDKVMSIACDIRATMENLGLGDYDFNEYWRYGGKMKGESIYEKGFEEDYDLVKKLRKAKVSILEISMMEIEQSFYSL